MDIKCVKLVVELLKSPCKREGVGVEERNNFFSFLVIIFSLMSNSVCTGGNHNALNT